MLYIVRHGQTDWNNLDKIQGVADVPLNFHGYSQAYNIAKKIEPFQPTKIISSPLLRADETAKIIGHQLLLRVEYDARLREYDFGSLTGRNRADISPDTLKSFFADPTRFGAESFTDAFARVGNFMKSVDYDKNTLVVTHGGVINFMLCYLEDKNNFNPYSYLDKCLNTHIDNSAVLRIRNLKSGMTILNNTRFCGLPKSR